MTKIKRAQLVAEPKIIKIIFPKAYTGDIYQLMQNKVTNT